MKPGDFYRTKDGKVYQIREQLHELLFLAEEMECIEDGEEYLPTGNTTYVTAWELERYTERL